MKSHTHYATNPRFLESCRHKYVWHRTELDLSFCRAPNTPSMNLTHHGREITCCCLVPCTPNGTNDFLLLTGSEEGIMRGLLYQGAGGKTLSKQILSRMCQWVSKTRVLSNEMQYFLQADVLIAQRMLDTSLTICICQL